MTNEGCFLLVSLATQAGVTLLRCHTGVCSDVLVGLVHNHMSVVSSDGLARMPLWPRSNLPAASCTLRVCVQRHIHPDCVFDVVFDVVFVAFFVFAFCIICSREPSLTITQCHWRFSFFLWFTQAAFDERNGWCIRAGVCHVARDVVHIEHHDVDDGSAVQEIRLDGSVCGKLEYRCHQQQPIRVGRLHSHCPTSVDHNPTQFTLVFPLSANSDVAANCVRPTMCLDIPMRLTVWKSTVCQQHDTGCWMTCTDSHMTQGAVSTHTAFCI
jgi:hypothetical protein